MTFPIMPSAPEFLTWQDVQKLIDYPGATIARPV